MRSNDLRIAYVVAVPFLAASLACAAQVAASADPFPRDRQTMSGQRDLEGLASFFEGTFESVQDGQVNYVPMKLRHARIWPEREGEYWYYAEYVKAGAEEVPVRQRIYRLGEVGGALRLVTYGLPGEGKRFAGEWRKAKAFENVDAKALSERPGCRIAFTKLQFTMFAGEPAGTACPADMAGVATETTDFYLTSSSLRTWTQGFDKDGKAAWKLSFEPLELRRMSPTAR